ncbi:MAG: hypothetical protein J7L51_02620 [Desulfurococcales archaeon]|nr:hypothetical protein [Desulfurococcales archaeon]
MFGSFYKLAMLKIMNSGRDFNSVIKILMANMDNLEKVYKELSQNIISLCHLYNNGILSAQNGEYDDIKLFISISEDRMINIDNIRRSENAIQMFFIGLGDIPKASGVQISITSKKIIGLEKELMRYIGNICDAVAIIVENINKDIDYGAIKSQTKRNITVEHDSEYITGIFLPFNNNSSSFVCKIFKYINQINMAIARILE